MRSKFRLELRLRCVLFIILLSAGKLKGREMRGDMRKRKATVAEYIFFIVYFSMLYAYAIFTLRVFYRELLCAGCKSNMKQQIVYLHVFNVGRCSRGSAIKMYVSYSCCISFIPLLLRFQLLPCVVEQRFWLCYGLITCQ